MGGRICKQGKIGALELERQSLSYRLWCPPRQVVDDPIWYCNSLSPTTGCSCAGGGHRSVGWVDGDPVSFTLCITVVTIYPVPTWAMLAVLSLVAAVLSIWFTAEPLPPVSALWGAVSAWEHCPLASPEQSVPTGRLLGQSAAVRFCGELASAELVSAMTSTPKRDGSQGLVSELTTWDLSADIRFPEEMALWLSAVVWLKEPTPARLSVVVWPQKTAPAQLD